MDAQAPNRGEDWPWQVGEGSEPVWLDCILRDKTLHVRERLTQPTAKKYADEMRAGMLFPPVSLGKVGDKLFLLDGWHRIDAACFRNGAEAVEAIVTTMTPSEAVWAACAANLTHGQPYSPREKRNVLSAYIRAKRHMQGGRIAKSYRDIGKELGISLGSLYRWMELDHKSTFQAMQKDSPALPTAEPPRIDHDAEYLRRAQQAFRDAVAYADVLRSPELRFELIKEARWAVEQMKQKEHQESEW